MSIALSKSVSRWQAIDAGQIKSITLPALIIYIVNIFNFGTIPGNFFDSTKIKILFIRNFFFWNLLEATATNSVQKSLNIKDVFVQL